MVMKFYLLITFIMLITAYKHELYFRVMKYYYSCRKPIALHSVDEERTSNIQPSYSQRRRERKLLQEQTVTAKSNLKSSTENLYLSKPSNENAPSIGIFFF